MTPLVVYASVVSFIFLLVIAALLRQLNRERDERQIMVGLYQQLAFRVRMTQLADESSPQAYAATARATYDPDSLRETISTVAETEGA